MPPESQPGTRPRSGRLLHVTSWSGVGPFWSVGFDPSALKTACGLKLRHFPPPSWV